MTDHVARLYGLVVGVLVFFAAWAAGGAPPRATPATGGGGPPRAPLSARQQRVHLESLRVQKVVNARWAAYHAALAKRNAAAATLATSAAPSVKVVTLPPLTVTRVS
jgi:hypothetical protein